VLSATWTAADGYFRRLFELRADVLRAMGPEGYLRASLMFMRPPAWIRDNNATQDEDIAAMTANFPLPEVMLSRIAALLRFDRRSQLGHISAPTLILGARDDTVTPIYFSEALSRLIPGAETAILEAGGHFFPISAAEEFRGLVLDFLANTVHPARAAQ